jgi:DNA-binding NarL/FixJ family response regulator
MSHRPESILRSVFRLWVEVDARMALHITPAERSALQLLATGRAGHEIAGRLGTAETDLEAHLTALFARMGVASRSEAIMAAVRRGLLTSE